MLIFLYNYTCIYIHINWRQIQTPSFYTVIYNYPRKITQKYNYANEIIQKYNYIRKVMKNKSNYDNVFFLKIYFLI